METTEVMATDTCSVGSNASVGLERYVPKHGAKHGDAGGSVWQIDEEGAGHPTEEGRVDVKGTVGGAYDKDFGGRDGGGDGGFDSVPEFYELSFEFAVDVGFTGSSSTAPFAE